MYNHGEKGLLITFCGLDGCGKTTMIRRLHEYLHSGGISPILTKQPTNAVRQSEISRTYMDSPDHDAFDYRSLSLLAASDRIQHCNKVIVPELKKGKIVISDRYFYSCIANLRARGYTEDSWIQEISGFIPMPDIAFFMDVPVSVAVSRVRSRPAEKDRFIDIPLQYRLHDEYRELSKTTNGVLLSSLTSEEETFAQILQAIRKKIGERK